MHRTRQPRPAAPPLTTAQALGSLVKSARDIMRKDKGLSGDLDRLPMLTWIMFLKFLDDMERIGEAEATMKGERFRPAVEPPYRWRDWAAPDDGITGNALLAFVNSERATLPDGTEGPGLFAQLRGLQGADGGDRRDVVATVFRGTVNRAEATGSPTSQQRTWGASRSHRRRSPSNGARSSGWGSFGVNSPRRVGSMGNCSTNWEPFYQRSSAASSPARMRGPVEGRAWSDPERHGEVCQSTATSR
jgi:hypothetical protein